MENKCGKFLDDKLGNITNSEKITNFNEKLQQTLSYSYDELKKLKEDDDPKFSLLVPVGDIILGMGASDQSSKDYYDNLHEQFKSDENFQLNYSNKEVIYQKMFPQYRFDDYLKCIQDKPGDELSYQDPEEDGQNIFFTFYYFPKHPTSPDTLTINKIIPQNLDFIKPSVEFNDGDTIKKDVPVALMLRRHNSDKTARLEITFNETPENINIPFDPFFVMASVPVGSFVPSFLTYDDFLKINGLDSPDDNSDITKLIWVPCDGRPVSGSRYSSRGVHTVPDIRGCFLRCANDFGVRATGFYPVIEAQKNPDENGVGNFQTDIFKDHKHTYSVWDGHPNGQGYRGATYGDGYGYTGQASDEHGNPLGGLETRPKNFSVYYYIRIN